jgi:hypothetical protein
MTVPQWAWELATAFRAEACALPLFPFDLRSAILWAAPLTVEERPKLTVASVSRRLRMAGCVAPREKDRALRGCLVAKGEGGWAFLDADDAPAEKTFSLAHEVAHFLRHHRQPRRLAAALGPDALRSFDGKEAPTVRDRLHAALRGTALRPYAHLMHRHPAYVLPEVRDAEEEADILALELLAPEEEVRARARNRQEAEAALVTTFGLPAGEARNYAARLFPSGPAWPLLEHLKKAVKLCRTP